MNKKYDFLNLYDILDCNIHSNTKEIEEHFKKKCHEAHPDLHIENKEYWNSRFALIQKAHSVLCDDQNRELYNEFLELVKKDFLVGMDFDHWKNSKIKIRHWSSNEKVSNNIISSTDKVKNENREKFRSYSI